MGAFVKKQLLWSKMSIYRPQQIGAPKIYPETCGQTVTWSN